MNNPVRIMLAEDQAAYREVITLALKRDKTIELISQYGTAEFALRQIQSPTAKDVPDIVLLDLNLPGMGGLEAIPWFKKYSPNTKIIILTQSEAEADVLQAIRSGASGYLLKSSSPNQIKESIMMVMNGGASLDDRLARFILDTFVDKLPAENPNPALSPRELEILSLLADGLARKEISDQLKISKHTVITHIKHIFDKLEAINTPAAISKAYRFGILPNRR